MLVKSSSIAICLLAFFTIFPQNSTQQSVIPATCTYSYDTQTGFYTCRLTSGIVANPTDILNITGNHLPNRADSDVKIVWYPANNMQYLGSDILRKFENMTIFKLDCISLKEINQDAFEYCPNLEQFISTLSNLTTYPAQMMKNCQKLKVFTSMYQEFTVIPELFGDITSLEEVNLSSNLLASLPDKLVQNKPNLRIFTIRHNRLTELPMDFFAGCPNLQEIDLSMNQYDDQSKVTRAFNGNTNIKSFDLFFARINNFNFTFFEQFQQLEQLVIGGDWMTGISWQSLPSSLTALAVMSIGEKIPENAFNHLGNLTWLSLSGLGISSLHKDTFKALTKLEGLSVTSAALYSLEPELFANQGNLVDLTLAYNYIEELPVGIFAPLVNLGKGNSQDGINMYENRIKRLNISSFGEHPHLQELNFASNRIDGIQRGLFSKFSSNIVKANFNSNLCVDELFQNPGNLNEHESLKWCYDSWEGITTTSSTTTTTTTTAQPTTTPSGAGRNFRIFEIFGIVLIGFVGSFGPIY